MFVVEFQYKTTWTYDFQMDELRKATNWLELSMFVALGWSTESKVYAFPFGIARAELHKYLPKNLATWLYLHHHRQYA